MLRVAGLLDDKNFWWKSFRWIQGMKYYTCPRKGTLTAELTEKVRTFTPQRLWDVR
jgi:hypothetical protein